MNRGVGRLFASSVLILVVCSGARTEDETRLQTEVQDSFKRFAAAVKDNKYEEAVKYIAPPGDKAWINVTSAQEAAAKYEAALDRKFGKSDRRSILDQFRKPNLAEVYYQARGTIREVKEAGKDRAVVTVWTKGPRFGDDADRIYERKFTAANVDGRWMFQLPPPFGEGSPVVKKVNRRAADGKDVEVYAEHNPKGTPDQKKWEELKPSSYEGREKELKLVAEMYAGAAEVLSTQAERVQKGSYETRKEALDTLERALRELAERTTKKLEKGSSRP
jgi:hypothetical protein